MCIRDRLRSLERLIEKKEQEKQQTEEQKTQLSEKEAAFERTLKARREELESFGNLEELHAVLNAKYQEKEKEQDVYKRQDSFFSGQRKGM